MPTKKKAKKPAKVVKKAVKKTVKKAPAKAVKKAVFVAPKIVIAKVASNKLMSNPSASSSSFTPSKVKTDLSKKDLAFYKDVLLDLRSKIVGDLQHLESDSLKKSTEEMTGDHADIIDTAQDEFDREFVLSLAANEQQILNKIDVALHKIEDGTYGICEKYGTPIPKRRLMAMPYAAFSIKAQEEQEKGI